MGTINEVAKRAGVSTATVSRVVNNSPLVKPATVALVQQAIIDTNYMVNRAARSLKTRSTGLLGFVTSDLLNPFTTELAHSMTMKANEHGFSLLTAVTFGSDEQFAKVVSDLRQHQVDGIIVTHPPSDVVNDVLAGCVAGGTLISTIGNANASSDVVSCDTYHGGRFAMDHLLALGHRRIALATGAPLGLHAPSRLAAYRDALAAAGLDYDPELVIASSLDREGGRAAIEHLVALDQPATALFTVNDTMALGAMQAAHDHRLSVPDDLSIVGFDDIAMASHASPPLTTVAQPKSKLGELAAQMLIERLLSPGSPPQTIRLDSQLMIRSTTAPPRR